MGEVERAGRREGVPGVGGALQRGEVVEQRRSLSTRLRFDLRDGAPPAPHLGGDGVSRRLCRDTAPLRVAPAAVVRARGDLELGDDFTILDRNEGGDLLVTRDDEGERRRLDPP